jgi:type II secretory pathway pseudopilin PulG
MKYFFKKIIATCTTGTIAAFTLLETLASVTILVFVVIGPLTTILNSSAYARQSKDVMVASYLADEATELLQNQYDSIYIYCKNNPADVLCTPGVTPAGDTESNGQLSWKLFKARFGAIDSYHVSCIYPLTCAYDYTDMTAPINQNPERYTTTGTECPYVVPVKTTTPVPGALDGATTDIYTYACAGQPSHTVGTVGATRFTRSVTMQSIGTFDATYNDDVRVTSQVQFKGLNGLTRSVKVIRFFHARP